MTAAAAPTPEEPDDATARILAEIGAECATHRGRGYDQAHDDLHTVGELVNMAGRYAYRSGADRFERADLKKATSLMVAAIARLDRGDEAAS